MRPRPALRSLCRMLRAARWWAMALLLSGAAVQARDVRLDALGQTLDIDRGRISLSGISSGAYMAQQFHVIHSSRVMGVGLVAGGPYRCAAGAYPPWSWFDLTGLYAATSRCSNTNPWWFYGGAPNVAVSLDETRHEARLGNIDRPAGLRGGRVWLFSGSEDDTVPRAVVDTLADYYEHFVDESALVYETLDGAGHAMITVDRGNPCDQHGPPFITDCDFDAAGRMLAHLYGPLEPRAAQAQPSSLHRFDQSAYFATDDASVSLHDTAYVYVPQTCADGASCALHVAFHGCQQSVARIGTQFVEQAGYNEWAETNRTVVLYPQAVAWEGRGVSVSANPRGCWDWWGYSGADYHRRSGKQPAAVARMINALLGAEVLKTGSR